jgi:hypothetical protein
MRVKKMQMTGVVALGVAVFLLDVVLSRRAEGK